jgi:hypothetical protein
VKNQISIPCHANEVICDAGCLTPPGFIAQVEALSPARKREMRRGILDEVWSLAPPWSLDFWIFVWFDFLELLGRPQN